MNGLVVLGAAPIFSPQHAAGASAAAAVRQAAARATRRLVTRQSALLAALDAVIELESSPHLAVGVGADFRSDGVSLELDALVATSDGLVGSVSCLRDTQHPVLVASAAREHGAAGVLTGDAAVRFARSVGFAASDARTRGASARFLRRVAKPAVREEWHALDVSAALLSPPADEGVPVVAALCRDAAGRFALACSAGGRDLAPGVVSPVATYGVQSFVGAAGAIFVCGPSDVLVRRAAARLGYSFMADGMLAQEAANALLASMPEPGRYSVIALSVSDTGVAHSAAAYPTAVVTL